MSKQTWAQRARHFSWPRVAAIFGALVIPLAATAQSGSWSPIASEGAGFSVTGTQTVRYGAGDRWLQRVMSGSGQCTNAFFGADPAFGVVKTCQTFVVSTPPPNGTWVPLVMEGASFTVSGSQTVRFGAGSTWVHRNVVDGGQCTNLYFGSDPAYGVIKSCQLLQATAPGPQAGPCAYAPAGEACKIDALAYDTAGTRDSTLEVVMAYGRSWKYDMAGRLVQPATDLKSVTRYGGGAVVGPTPPGPCSNLAPTQRCQIDSLVLLRHDQWGYVESISAYGRGWNFDESGTQWTGGGSNFDLTSVSRYGGGAVFGPSTPGPCSYKPAGEACKFDTRVFVDARTEWGDYFESITAYGRYFIFNSAGTLIETNTLTSVARYRDGAVFGPSNPGPCSYKPAGTVCKFDAIDFKRVNGALVEVILAYGRYWEFVDGSSTPVAGTGVELKDVARFR